MPYTAEQLIAAHKAANNQVAPDATASATLTSLAAQTQAGLISDTTALAFVIDSAQDDVAVAIQAYQFFTGKNVSAAGLDFLTNSSVNPNDLNDPFYQQFNLENRYINFAANLGIVGEGAAAFAATYGAFSFATFVDIAYETIIGSAYAQAAGISVAAAKADIISRQANFLQLARDRQIVNSNSTAAQNDLAVKAALIGYLMSEGVKADVGIYAASANNFINALINGNAVFNTDLIATYAGLGGGTGSPVSPGATTPGGGGDPTPPGTSVDVMGGGAPLVLSNIEPDTTLRVISSFTAGNGLTANLKDATGASDSLTVSLAGAGAGGITVPILTTPGVETLRIVSIGGTGSSNNVVGKLTADASLGSVKISGSGPLTVVTDAFTRASTTLDGSAAGGSLRLDASATVAAGASVNLIGGAANDTLTAGLGAINGAVRPPQQVNGGRGGDLIVLGGGHGPINFLVYKSALDSQLDLTVGASAGASATDMPNTLRMDVVSGFISRQDVIDLSAFALSSQQAQIADKGVVASDMALTALAGQADFYRDTTGVLRGAAQVHYGADVFLFIDANKDGAFNANSDLVVKFTGLAALSSDDIIR